jgi:hypothetical protein
MSSSRFKLDLQNKRLVNEACLSQMRTVTADTGVDSKLHLQWLPPLTL